MDWWEKVDLTLTGYIGDDQHPNKPWELRQGVNESPLYQSFTKGSFDDIFKIMSRATSSSSFFYEIFLKEWDDLQNNLGSAYYKYFGEWPKNLMEIYQEYGASFGKYCDRCWDELNLLNAEIIRSGSQRVYTGVCLDCNEVLSETRTKFFKE